MRSALDYRRKRRTALSLRGFALRRHHALQGRGKLCVRRRHTILGSTVVGLLFQTSLVSTDHAAFRLRLHEQGRYIRADTALPTNQTSRSMGS